MKVFQQADTLLGSEIVLSLCASDEARAQSLFEHLWEQIRVFDKRFSRFRPDSELAYFNAHAGQWTTTTTPLAALLTRTKQMAEATGGMFNPFILPALQRSGYVASFTPTDATRTPPDYRDRRLATIDELEIEGTRAYIPKDTALDFGGIGKGYLLDELGEFLRSQGCKNFWLSLGGDILVSGKQPGGKSWDIAIADANQPDKAVAEVHQTARQFAVATSGITKRKGVQDGQAWHHIIDPSSGEPSQTDILTATIIMPTATLADVYASCVVASGSQGTVRLAEQHRIDTLFVQAVNSTKTIGRGIKRL